MSVNKYQPHLFILPEDDANKDIALGFLEHQGIQHRQVQIRTPAGGWKKVLEKFRSDYLDGMRTCPHRMMVLLIDLDNDDKRLEHIREEEIPKEYLDRVFVLGVQPQPEKLKTKERKSLANIGCILAEGCPNSRNDLWSDELLRHNEAELNRMILKVQSFLFKTS